MQIARLPCEGTAPLQKRHLLVTILSLEHHAAAVKGRSPSFFQVPHHNAPLFA